MTAATRQTAFTALLLLAALVWLASALFYLALPPSPDQSIFDYVGLIAAHGGHYYRDAFDISWPGPFLYHEAGARLFGPHPWTARAIDLCLLPVGLLGLWSFARNAGFPRAAPALLLLYPPLYVTSGGWMGGHRDIVAMHVLLCAAALLLGPSRRWWVRLLVGGLIGYATMLRPTYLFVALPFWLLVLRRSPRDRLRATLEAAAGMLAVFAAFLLAGVLQGTLGDWYEEAVLFPATAYQVPESRLRLLLGLPHTLREQFLWPTLAGVLAYPLWALRGPTGATPPAFARACWWALVATVLVSFFVQNKGFGYHLGGLLPLLLLSAAMGIEAGWRARPRSLPTWALLVAAAATVALGILARTRHTLPALGAAVHGRLLPRHGAEASRVAAAEVVRARSAPGDRVLQWGWNYEIPYLADRLPATRLVNTNLLAQIRPQDTRLLPWLDELAGELAPTRVKLVVLDLTVLPRTALAAPAAGQPRSNQLLLGLVRQGYRPIFDRDDILVLARAD